MKRVLIIDDEEDICTLLESQLRKKSFEVRYETSLTKGLHAIEEFDPAVIILDNNLPDGLGIESLPQICSRYPEAQVLIVSAFTSLNTEALKRGADAFIAKPFSISSILDRIK